MSAAAVRCVCVYTDVVNLACIMHLTRRQSMCRYYMCNPAAAVTHYIYTDNRRVEVAGVCAAHFPVYVKNGFAGGKIPILTPTS